MIAVAATASGGDTIAPRAKAAAHGSAGTMECAIQATASVVARTNPMASRSIGRRFRSKSRHGPQQQHNNLGLVHVQKLE